MALVAPCQNSRYVQFSMAEPRSHVLIILILTRPFILQILEPQNQSIGYFFLLVPRNSQIDKFYLIQKSQSTD